MLNHPDYDACRYLCFDLPFVSVSETKRHVNLKMSLDVKSSVQFS